MQTILIVEDEKDLSAIIEFNLKQEGYSVIAAYDGASGLNAIRRFAPDLILLDIMLPAINGIELCKILKKDPALSSIPIIMLTAKGAEIDRVLGFELGVDDYMVKPFSMRELILRIKAVLKRVDFAPVELNHRAGDILLNVENHAVTIAGEAIELTAIEFKLLLYLIENKGKLLSRETLLTSVWDYNYAGDTRTVDTHVTRLRNKLGTAGAMIKTVRGFGYKLEE